MNVLVDISHGEDWVDAGATSQLAEFAMRTLGLPEHAEVSIAFVDNDRMHELNKRFRGIDAPTDVLSFECDNLEDEFPDEASCEIYSLGDVVIAPDVARAQAGEYGSTPAEEIELLLVHGVLHLCGYDHIDDDEALAMQAKERDILAAWRKK